MRKITFIIALYFPIFCFGQNYYAQEKIIDIDGYTYVCKHDKLHSFYFVQLYKNNPRFVGKKWLNKDGSVPDDLVLDGYIETTKNDNWTRKASYDIVNKYLKNSGIILRKGHGVDITMYIDPDNGKVVEVKYSFRSDRDFAKVPPRVYYEIEKELKEKIYFIPTEEGKKLNFLVAGWMHKIE